MQAILRRVELSNAWNRMMTWTGPDPAIKFAISILLLFGGMALNNGDATHSAVSSVQHQYEGKLAYHARAEKVLAKTAKAAVDACNHNLDAALANDADAIRNCPKPSPIVKALAK